MSQTSPSAALVETIPYILLHVACVAVFWVGFSWAALALCVGMYGSHVALLVFTTGTRHKLSVRADPFNSSWDSWALRRFGGPIWWGAHRDHHSHSDTHLDLIPPNNTVWKSLRMVSLQEAAPVRVRLVRDWMKFPELVWLDRHHHVPAIATAFLMLGTGYLAAAFFPNLGWTPGQGLVWGFFVSTVLCYHGTYTINSLAHVWGRRDFQTKDDSRNNFFLAINTLGEGWHNNHHHYPATVRQGFRWWELDPTWWILCAHEGSRFGQELQGRARAHPKAAHPIPA